MNFARNQIINKSTFTTMTAIMSAGVLEAGSKVDNIKWNVAVLMTDMHNVHYLGSDHQSRENILTPNLDIIGQDGIILRKAFDAYPVCAPTRASLLTGVTQPMCNYITEVLIYRVFQKVCILLNYI